MGQEKKSQILIVDDSPQNIQVLGNTLAKKGYEIFIAQNGIQALKKVESIMPDLILLDVLMPELDGFETCQRLKKSPLTSDIPVIFLTAKTEPEDIIKGFELGAVDYLTKPFNPSELLVRVGTHLELKEGREALIDAHREMKELVHILCHDLANPMNNVISVLDSIGSYNEFETFKELLKTSAENGLDLINLVRDMRDAEENDLILERVNVADAINTSISILSNRFSEKSIKVEVDIPGDYAVVVEKTSFINSVVNNVLANGIKFSHPGSVITISADKQDEEVRVFIKDSGIGMPESIRENIFDMNTNSTRLGTQGEKGNGFGMPMVKKFMSAYHGDVSITSTELTEDAENHGTTITLIFPQYSQ